MFRIINTENKYYLFEEIYVNNVIQDLGVSSSLRTYSDMFWLIFDYTIKDGKEINDQYYQTIKNEVIGLKN